MPCMSNNNDLRGNFENINFRTKLGHDCICSCEVVETPDMRKRYHIRIFADTFIGADYLLNGKELIAEIIDNVKEVIDRKYIAKVLMRPHRKKIRPI